MNVVPAEHGDYQQSTLKNIDDYLRHDIVTDENLQEGPIVVNGGFSGGDE